MRRLRWDVPKRQVPKHPYRDSAILYAVLAGIVVAVSVVSGADVARSLIVTLGFFVAATLYSWWRWHGRLRRQTEEK